MPRRSAPHGRVRGGRWRVAAIALLQLGPALGSADEAYGAEYSLASMRDAAAGSLDRAAAATDVSYSTTARVLVKDSRVHVAAAQRCSSLPKIIDSFCTFSRDFKLDPSGAVMQGSAMNYSLCVDVKSKSHSITCVKGVPCGGHPWGPDTAKVVYTGTGTSYTVDWSGRCTERPCQFCDPPNAVPFSFLVIDDDSRGVATRVGSITLDEIEVDHYAHARGPGMTMNWYMRNVSSSSSSSSSEESKQQLVRNVYERSSDGQPAVLGIRDFSMLWSTPAPPSSFAIPSACSTSVSGSAGPLRLAPRG
jgi:hypothetical protein